MILQEFLNGARHAVKGEADLMGDVQNNLLNSLESLLGDFQLCELVLQCLPLDDIKNGLRKNGRRDLFFDEVVFHT